MVGALVDRPMAVLVEGPSDVAAVTAAAELVGLDLAAGDVTIVSMGGVTNIGRDLALARRAGMAVAGLCDAGEVRFVQRALGRDGIPGASLTVMAQHGFFVCQSDLEDELLRALGPKATECLLDGEGELQTFRRFQHQPAQRDRVVHDQLHRFVGTRSGRKIRLARAMTLALDRERIPEPVAGLLEFVTSEVGEHPKARRSSRR